MWSAFDLSEFQDAFSNKSDDGEDPVLGMAKTAEHAERYEDMCQFMKYLVDKKVASSTTMTVEERNLFSVAYKNVIGSKRAAWRTLSSGDDMHSANMDNVNAYTALVEKQLVKTCKEVLDLLDLLIPNAGKDVEGEVFYLKMAGDYYRYLAETVDKNKEYPEKAQQYYSRAHEIATKDDALVPTHPIRLGLALNYSVCYFEILKDKAKACELAKKAFDDAIEKLDKLEENDYKDSTLIMQLLRDNLTLWSGHDNADGNVQVEDLSDEEN